MSGASALVLAPNSLRKIALYFLLGLPDCCSVIFLMCFFGCCLQLGGGWSDKKRTLSFFFSSSVTGSFVIGGPSCVIAINPSSQLLGRGRALVRHCHQSQLQLTVATVRRAVELATANSSVLRFVASFTMLV